MVIDARPLYRELTAFLEGHAIPDAAFDVRCMFEQVTGERLERLLEEGIPAEDENPLRNMAQRCAFGEPLQYILGEWEFFGLRIFVGKGVLIPRPDTETLVEAVLDDCRGRTSPRIADLCCGSGCIALALWSQRPDAEILGIDLSEAALAYARQNTAFHRAPVQLLQGDVLAAETAQSCGKWDVIVSNPPYLTTSEMGQLQTEVRSEPPEALAGGTDGLDYYRAITELWTPMLADGGLLAYEIGEQQGAAVADLLRAHGYIQVRILRDLAKHDRVVLGLRPGAARSQGGA